MVKNPISPHSFESSIWAITHNYASIMANASWIQAMNQETAMMKMVHESLKTLESSRLNLQPLYQSAEIAKLFSQFSQTSELTKAMYQANRYMLSHQEQIARITRTFSQNPMAQSWNNTENILSSLPRNVEINRIFADTMELMKEMQTADNAALLSRKQSVPHEQDQSIRSLLPPLNLSDKDFQVFLLILGIVIQCLCDAATSSDSEILKNQQTQIAMQQEMLENQQTQIEIQKQTLEELKKLNAAHSSDISTSPTDNRKETKS